MRYNSASYFHIIYSDDKKVPKNRGPDERVGFPVDSWKRNANAPGGPSFPWIFACRRRDVRRVRPSRNERRQLFRPETLTICSSSSKATMPLVFKMYLFFSLRREGSLNEAIHWINPICSHWQEILLRISIFSLPNVAGSAG